MVHHLGAFRYVPFSFLGSLCGIIAAGLCPAYSSTCVCVCVIPGIGDSSLMLGYTDDPSLRSIII